MRRIATGTTLISRLGGTGCLSGSDACAVHAGRGAGRQVSRSPRARRAGEGRQAAAGRAAPARATAGGAGGREGRRVRRRVAPRLPRPGRRQQLRARRLRRPVPLLARRRQDRAQDRRRREVIGRFQGLDDPAAQGRPLVRRRAVHRRRHRVLVQGRPAEQGPDAVAAELDPQCRRHRREGGEGRRQHGALHLRPAGDAVPDRGRQPGRRRSHLRDVPAGALPEEVPSRLHRQGGSRQAWRRPRASRPGPSCSAARTRRRRTRSVRPWRRGCR